MKRALCTLLTAIVSPLILSAQKAPKTPHLEVTTANNQTTYHIGERIPLTLTFTGPNDKTFAIDLANYDRSGRMYEDSFLVAPSTGWQDPLHTYFTHAFLMGGGLRGGSALSQKPVTVNANLNEWVRFDEPGTYTVSVISHRVGRNTPHGARRMQNFPDENIDLPAENKITIKIVAASSEWQQSTVERALLHLPSKRKNPFSVLDPDQANAIADLRFLGTPAAAAVLASRLRDDVEGEFDAYLGLLGLPAKQREPALASMNKLIEDPRFPIYSMFLKTAAWLRTGDDVTAPSTTDSEARKKQQDFQDNLEAQQNDVWLSVARALLHKTGSALSVTEATLLGTVPKDITASTVGTLGTIVRQSFDQLSPPQQLEALGDAWDIFGSRELLPQLRARATGPLAPQDQINDPFFASSELKAAALQRWYELEPEAAAAEAVRQIGREYPVLGPQKVPYLAGQTFPQFEPLWAKTLAEGDDFTSYEAAAGLLLHFGTGIASAQIAEILRHPKDHLGNRLQPAIAYLIKFDPDTAKLLLAQQTDLLDAGLDSMAKDVGPSPILQHAALTNLENNPRASKHDALDYLRHFGDNDTQQAICNALAHWYDRNQQYAGRNHNELSEQVDDDLNLGPAFVSAILGNQSWMPDASLTRFVKDHSIGEEMQKRIPNPDLTPVSVTAWDMDFSHIDIGPFEAISKESLEAKLDQFPQGTKFTLQRVNSPGSRSRIAFEDSLPALFEKHGMKLVPATP